MASLSTHAANAPTPVDAVESAAADGHTPVDVVEAPAAAEPIYTADNKVDLPPPVHFSKCTTRFPYKTYGVRKRNLGKSSINRQIQKYVANHNKDGPKTKLKMKKFLTALSSVLYFMFYFPPYVLYGKRVVHFEKWTGGGKSTLVVLQVVLYCTRPGTVYPVLHTCILS